MTFALIATDIVQDPCLINAVFPAVNSLGFSHNLVSPLPKTPDALRMLAMGDGHVDLVVVVHTGSISSGSTDPWTVISEIRKLDDALSLSGAVKARSVPIVAIINNFLPRPTNAIRWCVEYDFVHTPVSLDNAILEVIHTWRSDLLNELECVGYAVSIDLQGLLSVDPTFKRPDIEGEILARNSSIEKLRESRFLILSKDFLRDLEPYAELQYLLNDYREIAKTQKTKPEEVFQKFFERYPSMIMREQFGRYWARPRLRLPENPRNYLEPDFVLRPGASSLLGTKWQVLDIKLPDVALTTSPKFHPGFSAKLLRAVQQLRDYREYFNRQDAKQELLDTFGIQPHNPRLAVLIGRNPDKEEVETITTNQGTMNMLDIEVITYDELLETHARRLIMQSHLLD